MVPIADETTAHLSSPWAHPSFGGRFLASERSVTDRGFDARWRVSSLVTSAREQVRGGMKGAKAPVLQSFDVSLAQPLNVYSMSTRATKYGPLFIGLVLMAAFMFELFRKLRLHPVQYGLVGLSIALFFLLLLALSEKVLFGLAYAGRRRRQRRCCWRRTSAPCWAAGSAALRSAPMSRCSTARLTACSRRRAMRCCSARCWSSACWPC